MNGMPRAGAENVASFVLRVGGRAGADVRSSLTDSDCSGLPCDGAVARRQHGPGGHFIPRGGPKALLDAESRLTGGAVIVDVTDDAAQTSASFAGSVLVSNAARQNGFVDDWRMVSAADAAFDRYDKILPRFYLSSLKTYAYLHMRLGNQDSGAAAANELLELEPADKIGAGVLLDVRERMRQSDDRSHRQSRRSTGAQARLQRLCSSIDFVEDEHEVMQDLARRTGRRPCLSTRERCMRSGT
ncbi:hypothetical protein H8A97_20165 [Bradyrhizobium sp. Arg62]|uniref:hypothetical protein n=1 Tax=Bradyrhizobium TaxID=374 RepID=UPI0027E3A76A|nr:hypothetical protein [Bradyrhizobium ivorense]MCC8935747.1 hypothetical protein [Bradyrhizobium ivorense]MCC8947368.1 hypothetical protein [Bradyrhizobium brasilense]